MPLTDAVLSNVAQYPVLLTGDPAAVIGDGDDVVELLATVDRDGYLAPLSSQSMLSKDSGGSLLGPGG